MLRGIHRLGEHLTEVTRLSVLCPSAGVKHCGKNIPEVVLASTFSADYTVYPYAYASAAITSTHLFQSERKFRTGLHADSGSDASHRAVHHGEGKKNHAAGLGNVMCADIVAFDVR